MKAGGISQAEAMPIDLHRPCGVNPERGPSKPVGSAQPLRAHRRFVVCFMAVVPLVAGEPRGPDTQALGRLAPVGHRKKSMATTVFELLAQSGAVWLAISLRRTPSGNSSGESRAKARAASPRDALVIFVRGRHIETAALHLAVG